ncbi:MAG TPA: hypothetical protein VH120_14265 [Gemmataceae bacterium]|nr:hypothetical protein [Gemmataceae bacterium]
MLDAQKTYQRLSNGEHIEGLEELPIEEMMQRVRTAFSLGWMQLDRVTWEAPKKSFQVFTTPQFFRVDCGGMTGEEINVFIDIGNEFGCPLYDPQTGKRYEG